MLEWTKKMYDNAGPKVAEAIRRRRMEAYYCSTAEEAARDTEGMQTMRTLGRNMAWLLRCIELGKQHGVPFPQQEKVIFTNFMDGK